MSLGLRPDRDHFMGQTMGHIYYLSAGLKLSRDELNKEDNLYLFGDDFSPEGMGANFKVEIRGDKSSSQSEGQWKKILEPFDHCLLNDVLQGPPTLENLTMHLWGEFSRSDNGIVQIKVEQAEQQVCWVGLEFPQLTYGQRMTFSGLHRHHNSKLTPEENAQLFGKCSRVHGHEYQLWIYVTNGLKEGEWTVLPRAEMKRVKDEITSLYSGRYLNEVIGNTSGELLLIDLLKRIDLKKYGEVSLELRETRKNRFFTHQRTFV